MGIEGLQLSYIAAALNATVLERLGWAANDGWLRALNEGLLNDVLLSFEV